MSRALEQKKKKKLTWPKRGQEKERVAFEVIIGGRLEIEKQ